MRAAAAVEELIDKIGHGESSEVAVGVLETRAFPPAPVIHDIAKRCHVDPSRLTLLVAPTASQAGSIQIAGRSVETALHKLHELGFDLSRVASGFGSSLDPEDVVTRVGFLMGEGQNLFALDDARQPGISKRTLAA